MQGQNQVTVIEMAETSIISASPRAADEALSEQEAFAVNWLPPINEELEVNWLSLVDEEPARQVIVAENRQPLIQHAQVRNQPVSNPLSLRSNSNHNEAERCLLTCLTTMLMAIGIGCGIFYNLKTSPISAFSITNLTADGTTFGSKETFFPAKNASVTAMNLPEVDHIGWRVDAAASNPEADCILGLGDSTWAITDSTSTNTTIPSSSANITNDITRFLSQAYIVCLGSVPSNVSLSFDAEALKCSSGWTSGAQLKIEDCSTLASASASTSLAFLPGLASSSHLSTELALDKA